MTEFLSREETFARFTTTPAASMREVVGIIDRNGEGVALIVDAEGRLEGIITDGDIRRAFLDGTNFEISAGAFLSAKQGRGRGFDRPLTMPVNTSLPEINRLMRVRLVRHMPLVDASGRIASLVLFREMAKRIPLSVPHFSGNEIPYLLECVETNWVSSVGPFVDRFEKNMAARLGGAGIWAMATVNGTSALHLALMAAGVKPDDAVLVSSLSFIAPANAIRYVGAEPVFVDADPETWQMDPRLVSRFLEEGASGRRVGAILLVHILGHPVEMDPILELSRIHGIPVIGDATESLGALYQGRPVELLGDITCLSFNGNKLMTTGGGGMVLTRREDWARRVRHLGTQAKADEVEFIHDEVGYNYRMTNLAAALGVAQLERLDDLIAAKRRIAARYREACADIPGLTFMPSAPWAEPVFWLSTVLVDAVAYGMDRKGLMAKLREFDIETRPLWQPLHRSPAHAGAPALGGEVAERLQKDALCLPSSCGLKPDDQERIIATLASLAR